MYTFIKSKKEHLNWYRVSKGLEVTSKALQDVVKTDILKLHSDIKNTIGSGVCTSNCDSKTETGLWCIICKQWQNELKSYFHDGRRSVPWRCTRPEQWPEHPWEMVKVFANILLQSSASVESVTDLDISALTSIITNCTAVTGLSPQKVTSVRETRNDIGHTPQLGVSHSKTKCAFQNMISLLQEPRIANTKDGKTALRRVRFWEGLSMMILIIIIVFTAVAFGLVLYYLLIAYPGFVPYLYCQMTRSRASFRGCSDEETSCLNLPPKDIFFSSLLNRHKQLVRRQWLLDEIDNSIKKSRGVILQGPFATGKTGVSVSVICSSNQTDDKSVPQVLAYHFCQFDYKNTHDPVKFIRNIAGMIASRLGEYETFIIHHEHAQEYLDESTCREDIKYCFKNLILDPLNSIRHLKTQYLFVLDGLDECNVLEKYENKFKNEIAHVIKESLSSFPDWLKVFATTRDVHEDLVPSYPLKYITLKPDDPRHLNDIELATEVFFTSKKFSHKEISRIKNSIVKKCRGDFYHMAMLQEEYNDGREDFDGQVSDDVFLRHFERIWGKDGKYYSKAKDVFEVMLASASLLDPGVLCQIINENSSDSWFEVRNMSLVLSQDELGNFRFVHQSLAQWLTTTKSWAWVDTKEGHRKLARFMMRESEDLYKVDFLQLLRHLVHADDPELTTIYMMMPRNKTQMAIKTRHEIWKESNPKIIELFLYHWHSNISTKEAIFWSVVAGNPGSMVAFLNYDPSTAFAYMNSKDNLIPFYGQGSLLQLASHLNQWSIFNILMTVEKAIKFEIKNSDFVITNDTANLIHEQFYNFLDTKESANKLYFREQPKCQNRTSFHQIHRERKIQHYDIYRMIESPEEETDLREQENIFYIALAMGNDVLVNVILQHKPAWIDDVKLQILLNITNGLMPDKRYLTDKWIDSLALSLASLAGFEKVVWKIVSNEIVLDPWVYCYTQKEDIENKDKIKKCASPLQISVLKGHLAIVSMLLSNSKYSKLLNDRDISNMTALQLAIKTYHNDIAEFLINKSATFAHTYKGKNLLHEAFIVGNVRLVDTLINRNESLLDEKDDFHFLPVHYAVLHGDIAMLEAMNSRLPKDDGRILYIAAFSGCYKTVEFLIKKGFSNVWLNETFERGSVQINVSALHTAVVNNHTDIVKLILDNFPDVRHSATTVSLKRSVVKPWIVPTVTSMITNLIAMVDDIIPFQMSYKDMVSPWNMFAPEVRNTEELIINSVLNDEDNRILHIKKEFSDACPRLVRKQFHVIRKTIWVPLGKAIRELLWDFNNKTVVADCITIYEAFVQLNILQTQYAILLKQRLSKVPLLHVKPYLFESQEYRIYKSASDSLYTRLNQNIHLNAIGLATAMDHHEITSLLLNYGVGKQSHSREIMRQGGSSDNRKEHGGKPYRLAVMAVEKGNIGMLVNESFSRNTVSRLARFAVQRGNLEILKHFWGPSIENGSELMNIASASGHWKIVQFLIDQNISIETTCKDTIGNHCTNALHEATLERHDKIVVNLVKRFPRDIDAVSQPFGMTSLDIAVMMNHTKIATSLIIKKAKIRTKYHWNGILYTAIQKGNLALVQTLIRIHGCKLAHESFQSAEGEWFPLTIAAYYGHLEIFTEIEYCSTLESYGCIYHDKAVIVALMNGNDQVFEFLLKWGRSRSHNPLQDEVDQRRVITHCQFQGIHESLHYTVMIHDIRTMKTKFDWCFHPICIAAMKGHDNIVKVLLKNNETEKYARQIIERFASMGYANAVHTLIKAGVDIDSKHKDTYFQPVHLGAFYGHIDVLKVFSEYVNLDDYHTLEAAVLKGQVDVIDFLVEYGVQNLTFENVTILGFAAREGKLSSVKALIRHFPVLLHSDPKPSHLAANMGHIDVLKELFKYVDLDDFYTLHGAVLNNQIHVIDYLGNYGLHNYTIFENVTILHLASIVGNLSCMKTLVRLFPEVVDRQTSRMIINKEMFTNLTPLDLAVSFQHVDTAYDLLQHGASLKNETLRKLMSCAIEQDKMATVKYLLLRKPYVLMEVNEKNLLPQHEAAYYGRTNILKEFYKYKNLDDGKTFELACCVGHKDIVKYLISINITKPWRCYQTSCQTGLHVAAARGHNFLIKTILSRFSYIIDLKSVHYKENTTFPYNQTESGAISDDQSITRGNTALEFAISHNNLGVVASLLRYGAKEEVDYYITQELFNSGEKTMLIYLLKKGLAILINGEKNIFNPLYSVASYFEYFDILLQMSKYTDLDTGGPLYYACQGQNLKAVKYLVEQCGVKKIWWCEKTDDCKTVLHAASTPSVFSTNAIPELGQIVRILLKHFPTILNLRANNSNSMFDRHKTALEISLSYDNEIAAYVLLEAEAKINCSKEEMIFQAIYLSNYTIVKMLLANCPQLANAYNSYHGYPSQMAASEGYIDILKELSRYTDLDNGVTLYAACQHNQIDVVDFLLEHGIKNTTVCSTNFTVCTTAFYAAISQKNHALLKKLMTHFPDDYKITEKSKKGDEWENTIPLLAYAIERNMTEFVVDIFKENSPLTYDDYNILMKYAIYYNNTIIVAAISIKYSPEPMYLSFVSGKNKTDMVKTLLNSDASRDIKPLYVDEEGVNHKILALCYGFWNGNKAIVDALKNSGLPKKVNCITSIIMLICGAVTFDLELLWLWLELAPDIFIYTLIFFTILSLRYIYYKV